jgi:hypothetical protein
MFDKSIAAKPPTVDYKDIMESDGIAEWTRQIVCTASINEPSVTDYGRTYTACHLSRIVRLIHRRHKSCWRRLGLFEKLTMVKECAWT